MGGPETGVAVLRVSLGGGAGVLIFFVISGCLNTLSVIRHRSVRVIPSDGSARGRRPLAMEKSSANV
jgi:peptidoglycan/LPS O-acetylase OafA/YrhL